MKILFFSFVLIFSLNSMGEELKLKPFVTDYCTMFFEGPNDRPTLWKHCCIEHDLRYWYGGTQEDIDKADLKLKSCVENVAGSSWANVIYLGVRAGQLSPIKFRYKWSWGWDPPRTEKSPLTTQEKDYVQSTLQTMKVEDINIDDFISENF